MYQTAPTIVDEYSGPPSNANCFGASPTLACSANRATCFVIGVNESTVMNDFDNQCKLNEAAIASVVINSTWNSGTKTASGTIKVKFESSPGSGDFRIGLYVVEDSVTGPHPNYSQYDDADPANWPVKNFVHPWVLRGEILNNSFWGKNGLIPNSPQTNTEYSASFSYTVPAKYYDITPVPQHISLVAFVVKRTDAKTGTIYNCETAPLTGSTTQIGDLVKKSMPSAADIRIMQGNVRVTMQKPEMDRASLIDSQGRVVRTVKGPTPSQCITLECNGIATGVYVVVIESEQTRVYTKTILVKQ